MQSHGQISQLVKKIQREQTNGRTRPIVLPLPPTWSVKLFVPQLVAATITLLTRNNLAMDFACSFTE